MSAELRVVKMTSPRLSLELGNFGNMVLYLRNLTSEMKEITISRLSL